MWACSVFFWCWPYPLHGQVILTIFLFWLSRRQWRLLSTNMHRYLRNIHLKHTYAELSVFLRDDDGPSREQHTRIKFDSLCFMRWFLKTSRCVFCQASSETMTSQSVSNTDCGGQYWPLAQSKTQSASLLLSVIRAKLIKNSILQVCSICVHCFSSFIFRLIFYDTNSHQTWSWSSSV